MIPHRPPSAKSRAATMTKTDEWFRAALDASFDPLFMLECVRIGANAISDFTVVAVNARAIELMKQPMVGRRLSSVLPPPLFEVMLPSCARAVETKTIIDEEV